MSIREMELKYEIGEARTAIYYYLKLIKDFTKFLSCNNKNMSKYKLKKIEKELKRIEILLSIETQDIPEF